MNGNHLVFHITCKKARSLELHCEGGLYAIFVCRAYAMCDSNAHGYLGCPSASGELIISSGRNAHCRTVSRSAGALYALRAAPAIFVMGRLSTYTADTIQQWCYTPLGVTADPKSPTAHRSQLCGMNQRTAPKSHYCNLMYKPKSDGTANSLNAACDSKRIGPSFSVVYGRAERGLIVVRSSSRE